MSLGGRLLNVFATPGEVFQEIKTAPVSTANWLAPALILILVSWVAAWAIFSQPAINHQLSEVTERAIQKQIDQNHMSEQDAERARAMGEKWAGISAKIGAALAPVIGGLATPFLLGPDCVGRGRRPAEGQLPLHESGGSRWPRKYGQRARRHRKDLAYRWPGQPLRRAQPRYCWSRNSIRRTRFIRCSPLST